MPNPSIARRYFEAVAEKRSRIAETPPVCVYLEVTNRCNLLCETCPRTFEALEPPADMSWELFTAIVDQLPGLARAVLHGVGEPMLVKNLPRMIRYLKDRGVYVLFNTNGTLLAPKKRRELIDTGLDELRVSLDAAEAESFFKVRGKNMFDRIVRNVSEFTALQREIGADDAARFALADRAQGDRRSAPRFRPVGGADRRQGNLSPAPCVRRSRARARPHGIVVVREDAGRGRGGNRRRAGIRPRTRGDDRRLRRHRAGHQPQTRRGKLAVVGLPPPVVA